MEPRGPTGTPGTIEARESRPRQVTIVAVLLVLFGLVGIGGAWLLFDVVNSAVSHGESLSGGFGLVIALSVVQLALSGAQVVSGVLVWRGIDWARSLAIVLCSLNLLGGIVGLFLQGLSAVVGIVTNGVMIRLLTRDEVVDWCRYGGSS